MSHKQCAVSHIVNTQVMPRTSSGVGAIDGTSYYEAQTVWPFAPKDKERTSSATGQGREDLAKGGWLWAAPSDAGVEEKERAKHHVLMTATYLSLKRPSEGWVVMGSTIQRRRGEDRSRIGTMCLWQTSAILGSSKTRRRCHDVKHIGTLLSQHTFGGDDTSPDFLGTLETHGCDQATLVGGATSAANQVEDCEFESGVWAALG